MATEKRLIDANALRREIDLCDIETFNDKFTICEQIANAPTVDAVEVVRCKDCKKWFRHTKVDRERGDCRRYQTTKHEAGYCDRGERKDNVL